MIFGSIFARPRSSSNEITTKTTSRSEDPGSVNVYTIDSSYAVARCSLNSTSGSRGDTTSASGAIKRRCNRSHFKLELFGNTPMCINGKVTSIGFLRVAVFLEIVVFIACNVYAAIEAFVGHPAGTCMMGLLAILILLASLPMYLGMISGNGMFLLFAAGTHFISCLFLIAATMQALTLWKVSTFIKVGYATFIIVVLLAYVQMIVATALLSYFYDWAQRTGKLASFEIHRDFPNGNLDWTANATTTPNTNHMHSPNEKPISDIWYRDSNDYDSTGKKANNEKDVKIHIFNSKTAISSDDAYFDSASMSLSSLKSYPYEGQEKRAPGGAERCKEFRIPFANSENARKDLQNKLIPSEILPFERAPSPDSVYCDASFVESATPQSVYCITGLTKCSNDPHAYFDTGIPYSVGIHKVDIVPHRKMVYFASLQPKGALGDIIAPDSWNSIPLEATVHQTTPELSHKLTAKELVAQMPRSKI